MNHARGGSCYRLIPLVLLFLIIMGGLTAEQNSESTSQESAPIRISASATLPAEIMDEGMQQVVDTLELMIEELLVRELRSYARFPVITVADTAGMTPGQSIDLHAGVGIDRIRHIEGGSRILVEGTCTITTDRVWTNETSGEKQETTTEIAGIGDDLAQAVYDTVETLAVYISSVLFDHTALIDGGYVRYLEHGSVLIDPQDDPALLSPEGAVEPGMLLSIQAVSDEQDRAAGTALLRVVRPLSVITSRGRVDFIEAQPLYTDVTIVPGMATVRAPWSGKVLVPVFRGSYSAVGFGVEVFDERIDLLQSALQLRPLLELGFWYSWDDPYPDGSLQSSEEGIVLFTSVGSKVDLDLGSGPERGRFPLINTRLSLSASLGSGVMSPVDPVSAGHDDILIMGGRMAAGCEWYLTERLAIGAGGGYDLWFSTDGSSEPVFSLFSGQFRVTMRF